MRFLAHAAGADGGFLVHAPLAFLVRLVQALQANQAEADSFLGIVPGTTAIDTFFAPAHVRQIFKENERASSQATEGSRGGP